MVSKEQIKKKEQEIVDLARKLCLEKINEEYAELSDKLIRKMGRKREVPFIQGKSEIWATAAVNVLGTMNFLFDKSFLPYLNLEGLCSFFGLKHNAVESKSDDIIKLLKLRYNDPVFLTEYIRGENPLDLLETTLKKLLSGNKDFEEADQGESFDFDSFLGGLNEELNDELDFFDEGDEFEDDLVLDSAAIFIRPKQPFIDWVNALNTENPIDPKQYLNFTTYLVSDDELASTKKEIENLVKENYTDIFENELDSVWDDPDGWPAKPSFKMFKDWFEYQVSTTVYNLDTYD